MARNGPTGVEYKGYKVVLTENLRFSVTGPLLEHGETYDSIALAKMAIDKVIKVIAKQKTAALDVITETGKRYTVTGINRHTGRLITKPSLKDDYSHFDDGEFYPNVAALKPLLQKWRGLKRECGKLERQLEQFSIKLSRGYGRRDAEDYPEQINKLIAEYEKKKAGAEALGNKSGGGADQGALSDSRSNLPSDAPESEKTDDQA